MDATFERRAVSTELRTRGRRLEGYAALFDTEATIGTFSETIKRGAFGVSLRSGRDILALADHDPHRVLARTRSGSLRLSEDARGLAFDLDLPETQAGRDVLALAERGDIGGASFGFVATDEEWAGDRREVRAANLFEVSIVSAWPAYDGTVVNARSLTPHSSPRPGVLLRRLYLETL